MSIVDVATNPPGAVHFIVPGYAKTKGSMKLYNGARGGMRESVIGSTAWRKFVAERAVLAMAGRPAMRDCGIFVYATFYLAGDVTAARSGDVDKLLRNVLDALSSCTASCASGCTKHAGVYGDDVQVVLAVAKKERVGQAGAPRAEIMVGWYGGIQRG